MWLHCITNIIKSWFAKRSNASNNYYLGLHPINGNGQRETLLLTLVITGGLIEKSIHDTHVRHQYFYKKIYWKQDFGRSLTKNWEWRQEIPMNCLCAMQVSHPGKYVAGEIANHWFCHRSTMITNILTNWTWVNIL